MLSSEDDTEGDKYVKSWSSIDDAVLKLLTLVLKVLRGRVTGLKATLFVASVLRL
jgi:hypothetical protein